jgi:carbamoyl-phosphate synthase large subunit
VGSQVLGCLRLAARADLRILGCDMDSILADRTGLHAFSQVPAPSDPAYFEILSEVIRRNDVGLVFVTTLPEVEFFLRSRTHLQMPGVHFVLPDEKLFHLCMDKFRLFRFLQKKGIPIPRFDRISSISDSDRVDYYPAVLKKNSHTGASDHIFVAFDRFELRHLSAYLLHRNIDVFVQEYMGDETNEYSLSVTTDAAGSPVGSIAMRRAFSGSLSYKLSYENRGRRYPISSGISQGEIVLDHQLTQQAVYISRALNVRGSLNIQGKYVNGVFFPIDIHPALTGSVYAKALVGYNEPLYYVNRYLYGTETDLSVFPIGIGRKLLTYRIEEEGNCIADS